MVDISKVVVPRPEAVLFDLDGTLVDSVHDLAAALGQFLTPVGFPPIRGKDIRHWMGGDAIDLIVGLHRDFGPELPTGLRLEDLAARFLDFYDSWSGDSLRLFDGIRDLLETLNSRDVRIGVCTNKRSMLSERILGKLGILHFIDAVAGGDVTPFKKPDPAPVLYALERIKVAPDRAIMVGDSINDIAAARAAGIALVIGVDYGYPRDINELSAADIRVPTVAALREVLA